MHEIKLTEVFNILSTSKITQQSDTPYEVDKYCNEQLYGEAKVGETLFQENDIFSDNDGTFL